MPQSGIYMIVNTITGACYIGSAVDIQNRKRLHLHQLRRGKHHSPYMQRSFNQHGESAFVWTVLEEVPPDRDLLFERETYWVQTLQPQYNATTVSGSRLGMKSTPETIEKVRAYNLRPEVRQKHSEARKGIPLAPEVREKISNSLQGRPVSEETKALLLRNSLSRSTEERRQTSTGKKRTEETKRKMSEKATGRKHTEATRKKLSEQRLGMKRSEEAKQKTSETLQGHAVSGESRKENSEANKAYWANLTEEERRIKSEKARNRPPISEKTREKQRLAALNRKKNKPQS